MMRSVVGLGLVAALVGGCASDKAEKKDAAPAASSSSSSGAVAPAPADQTASPAPAGGGEVAPAPSGPAAPAPAAAAAGEAPRATGKTLVKGGESFTLAGGVSVAIKKVTYLNEPCPPGAKCVHSGVIKSVQFAVTRDGKAEEVFINEGAQQVVQKVMLRVVQVEAGPQAFVEISLPLGG